VYDSSTVTLEERFGPFQNITVGARKWARSLASLSSPRRRGPTQDGKVFALGNGGALAAGTPLTVTLTNLPYHSHAPRTAALTWRAPAPVRSGSPAPRRPPGHPHARRAPRTALQRTTQLELRRREGAVSADRFATRRRRLVADLEQLYGEIDGTAAGPQGGGEGVAA
jgi:hypothetical protein